MEPVNVKSTANKQIKWRKTKITIKNEREKIKNKLKYLIRNGTGYSQIKDCQSSTQSFCCYLVSIVFFHFKKRNFIYNKYSCFSGWFVRFVCVCLFMFTYVCLFVCLCAFIFLCLFVCLCLFVVVCFDFVLRFIGSFGFRKCWTTRRVNRRVYFKFKWYRIYWRKS
jgi:hypothetical protein